MKLIFHHLLKDIRAQRWLLLIWALVLLMEILINLLARQPDYDTARYIERMSQMPFFPLFSGITWIILLVRLIQSEPVTGSTSFWLTRPIPISVSVPSKLIFFVTFLILPGLVPEIVDMVQFQAGSPLVQDSLKTHLLLLGLGALCIVWLATFTRDLARFWVAAVFVALVTLLAFTAFNLLSAGATGIVFSFRSTNLIATRLTLFYYLFFPGLLFSLALQYGFRGRLGFPAAVVTTSLAVVVLYLWPVPFPFLFQTHQKTTQTPVKHLEFSLDAHTLTWSEPKPKTGFTAAHARLVPLASDPVTYPVIQGIFTDFQVPGASPEYRNPDTNRYEGEQRLDWVVKLREQLPGIALTPYEFVHFSVPPELPILSLSLPPYPDKFTGKTGTLTLHVNGAFRSLRQKAAIPLGGPAFAQLPGEVIRIHADLDDKPQLVVWAVGYRKDWYSSSPFGTDRYFVLVDPVNHTGTVLGGISTNTRSYPVSLGSSSKFSMEERMDLKGNEPLDRMVLYIFEDAWGAPFESTVAVPNFTLNPKLPSPSPGSPNKA